MSLFGRSDRLVETKATPNLLRSVAFDHSGARNRQSKDIMIGAQTPEKEVSAPQSQYGIRADGRDVGITFSDMLHARFNLERLGLTRRYKELAIFDRVTARVLNRMVSQGGDSSKRKTSC